MSAHRSTTLVLVLLSCGEKKTEMETITLAGLTLTGNTTQTYRNVRLVLRGDIIVQDDASLTIDSSQIQVEQAYHQQYKLEVRGNGRLVVTDSTQTTAGGKWHNWNFFDNARIAMNRFSYEILWCVLHGGAAVEVNDGKIGLTMLPDATGSVTVNGSSEVWFELALPWHGTYDLSLPKGPVASWSFPPAGSAIGYRVNLTNSTIYRIDLDISPTVDLTVRDSKAASFGWVMGIGAGANPAPVEIDGFRAGNYVDQTFLGDRSSLHLINTVVEKWWPTVWGNFQLTVRNSDLADPRSYDNATMKIYNSNMTLFAAYGNSKSEIHDSTINDSLFAADNALLDLFRVVFTGSVNTTGSGIIRRDGSQIAP